MTIALKALRKAQSELSELNTKAVALSAGINQAHAASKSAGEAESKLATVRAKRRDLLGKQYLGRADAADVQSVEIELAYVEAEARLATVSAEGAEAAAEQLIAENEALQAEIRALRAKLPALKYQAAVERVQSLMEGYREAAQALGKAFAAWQGAALLADRFADIQASPPRLPVLGAPINGFSLRMPINLGEAELGIDIGPEIQSALQDARELIGGG